MILKVEYIWVKNQQLSCNHWVSYSPLVQTLDMGVYNIRSGV